MSFNIFNIDLKSLVDSKPFKFSSKIVKTWTLGIFILLGCYTTLNMKNVPSNSLDHCVQFLSEDPEFDGQKYIWKPNGCTMYNYTKEELKKCFAMKKDGKVHFVIMGDSRSRNIFQYFEFFFTGTSILPKAHEKMNKTLEEYNMKMDLIWAPHTEIGNQTIEVEKDMRFHIPMNEALEDFMKNQNDPELLVLGNGLWSLYYKPNFTQSLIEYKEGLKKLKPMLESIEKRGKTKVLWYKAPRVYESILRTVGPYTYRMKNSGLEMHNEAVLEEFGDLFREKPGIKYWSTPNYFSRTELVPNPDGIHFAWPDTIEKVNMMLLNVFCNDKMGLSDDYCCVH